VDGSHQARRFDPDRYRTAQRLDGAQVLLIDDTWTTHSSVQSAACALCQAGARTVALIVMGRYLDFDFADHRQHFQDLPRGSDWATCVVHAGRGPTY
jgi:orotate phosphoribosyltransferase